MNAITPVLTGANRTAIEQHHELAEIKAMTGQLNTFLELPTTSHKVRTRMTQIALQSSRAIMKLLGQENGDLRNLIFNGEIMGYSKPENRVKMLSLTKEQQESIHRAIGAIQGLVHEVDPYEFRIL